MPFRNVIPYAAAPSAQAELRRIEEEKERKRQERMAKNRLSAKQSRERRLAHDESLKATIAKLTEEKEFHLAVKEGHNPLVKTGLDHSLISGDLKRSVTLSRYKSM